MYIIHFIFNFNFCFTDCLLTRVLQYSKVNNMCMHVYMMMLVVDAAVNMQQHAAAVNMWTIEFIHSISPHICEMRPLKTGVLTVF